MTTMNVKLLNGFMSGINMDDENIVAEREQFEFNKYGRRLHQEAAAHSHVYFKHSIEPAYGQYDEPIMPY
jgi:hypothetical protein